MTVADCAFDLDRPAHEAGIAVKQVLPSNPADQNHTIPARLCLFREEGATQHWRHAQHREKIRRDVESLLDAGMISAGATAKDAF